MESRTDRGRGCYKLSCLLWDETLVIARKFTSKRRKFLCAHRKRKSVRKAKRVWILVRYGKSEGWRTAIEMECCFRSRF
jgi:hypothetical protein